MYHSKKRVSLGIICASFMALGLAGCTEDSNSSTASTPDKPALTCDCATGKNCSASELKACPDNKDTCPAECPDDCTNGVCNSHEDTCPEECPNDCTDGVCNSHEDNCPEECPNDCTDGVCNTHETSCPADCPTTCDDDGECPKKDCPEECPDTCYSSEECTHEDNCPSECPNNCTDGVCNPDTSCPEECHDSCNEDGTCPSKNPCPEDCPDACNEDLSCPGDCPAECPDTCNANGECPVPCPDNCQNGCDKDGKCLCPSSCKTSCDANGKCECPSTCKSSCNANGDCQCPSTCKTSCDANGVCQCPSTCKTSCDANGVCQCPSTCKDTCNANGECPVLCGGETVKSMYFSYNELDLLTPDSTGRKSANMVVYIKTNKATDNMDTAPCKADIQLSMGDKSIATVAKNSSDPKKATFTAVAAGTTTCTVKLKGQTGITGSITVRVLNLDKLNGNLAAESSGKYSHLHKSLAMISTTRVSQGFDFYNKNFMYFTQLPKVKTTKTADGKVSYDRTELNIFKNDFAKNGKPMIFYAAGHGQNLSVENTGGKDYLWFSNYGNLICDDNNTTCTDGYKQSQTISRVLFEEGKQMYPSDATEHYYYKDKDGDYYYSFEPALDTKNNKFAFRAYYHKDGKTYVRIYHLSKVKAIANSAEKVKLPYAIKWINKSNEFKTNYKPSVTVKDLATIDPLNTFAKKKIAVQGLELENGIIYTVTGLPKKMATPEGKNGKYLYKSEIPIYVYKMDGTSIGGPKAATNTAQGNGTEYVYYLNTKTDKEETIEWLDGDKKKTYKGHFLNNSELDGMLNFTENGIKYEHNGYFEPEGIRVDDGKLYLSVTVRFAYTDKNGNAKTASRQVIFGYNLAK